MFQTKDVDPNETYTLC